MQVPWCRRGLSSPENGTRVWWLPWSPGHEKGLCARGGPAAPGPPWPVDTADRLLAAPQGASSLGTGGTRGSVPSTHSRCDFQLPLLLVWKFFLQDPILSCRCACLQLPPARGWRGAKGSEARRWVGGTRLGVSSDSAVGSSDCGCHLGS